MAFGLSIFYFLNNIFIKLRRLMPQDQLNLNEQHIFVILSKFGSNFRLSYLRRNLTLVSVM